MATDASDVILFGGSRKIDHPNREFAVDDSLRHPHFAGGYFPLDQLDAQEFESQFLAWTVICWAKRETLPTIEEELSKFDMDSLRIQFREEYEAGAWAETQRALTLEENCLAAQLSLRQPVLCLLNDRQPRQPDARVRFKEYVHPLSLVAMLHEAGDFGIAMRCQCLTYDGLTGHSIVVWQVIPPKGIVFIDPWPGRSLLCGENNAAGIDVLELIPLRSRGSLSFWFIEGDDFAKVVFALLVPTSLWNEYVASVGLAERALLHEFKTLEILKRRPFEDAEA